MCFLLSVHFLFINFWLCFVIAGLFYASVLSTSQVYSTFLTGWQHTIFVASRMRRNVQSVIPSQIFCVSFFFFFWIISQAKTIYTKYPAQPLCKLIFWWTQNFTSEKKKSDCEETLFKNDNLWCKTETSLHIAYKWFLLKQYKRYFKVDGKMSFVVLKMPLPLLQQCDTVCVYVCGENIQIGFQQSLSSLYL